jgi:hypothetical protein
MCNRPAAQHLLDDRKTVHRYIYTNPSNPMAEIRANDQLIVLKRKLCDVEADAEPRSQWHDMMVVAEGASPFRPRGDELSTALQSFAEGELGEEDEQTVRLKRAAMCRQQSEGSNAIVPGPFFGPATAGTPERHSWVGW